MFFTLMGLYYHAKFQNATANHFGYIVFTSPATEQRNKKIKKQKQRSASALNV